MDALSLLGIVGNFLRPSAMNSIIRHDIALKGAQDASKARYVSPFNLVRYRHHFF